MEGLLAFSVIIKICATLVGVPGNILVCVVIYREKKLRTWDNSFHVNLAVFDLLMCAVWVPATLVTELMGEKAIILSCYFFKTLSVVLTGNLLSLSLIAVQRYHKVTRPFGSAPRRAHYLAALISTWVVALLFGVLTALNEPGLSSKDWCPEETRFIISGKAVGILFQLLFWSCLAVNTIYYTRILLRMRRTRSVRAYQGGPTSSEHGMPLSVITSMFGIQRTSRQNKIDMNTHPHQQQDDNSVAVITQANGRCASNRRDSASSKIADSTLIHQVHTGSHPVPTLAWTKCRSQTRSGSMRSFDDLAPKDMEYTGSEINEDYFPSTFSNDSVTSELSPDATCLQQVETPGESTWHHVSTGLIANKCTKPAVNGTLNVNFPPVITLSPDGTIPPGTRVQSGARVQPGVSMSPGGKVQPCGPPGGSSTTTTDYYHHVAVTSLMIYLLFVASYIPTALVLLVERVSSGPLSGGKYIHHMMLFNNFLNPVIYLSRNKLFRSTARQFIEQTRPS